MSNIEGSKSEYRNFLVKKVAAFLTGKSMWVWWIFYTILTGALFGIFSLVLYLLTIQWWAGILILLAAGIIWGSIKFYQDRKKSEVKSAGAAASIKKNVNADVE